MKIRLLGVVAFGLVVCIYQSAWPQANSTRPRGRPMPVSSGRSGVLFDTALSYVQDEQEGTPDVSNTSKDNNSLFDIKLGYVFDLGPYLGVQYSTRNNAYTNGTTSGNATAVGIGHFWTNGFHLRAYYRFNEYYGAYKEGSGYQFELGYLTNIASDFYMGFNLTHHQTIFKTNGNIANFQQWAYRSTVPSIVLGFWIH